MAILTKIPEQNRQFSLEQMDNEHLLYNPLHLKTVYLNPSAALIWQLCDGQRTVSQIIETIETSYPESQAQIGADVVASVEQLVAEQVLFLK